MYTMCPPGCYHNGFMATTHCWIALWSHESAQTASSERSKYANSEHLLRGSPPNPESAQTVWTVSIIYISGEFHTDKSRIVLNNDGAVIIIMDIYSKPFHMGFNTVLFRRPAKSWSTHQLNSIYTVASLGFINIRRMIVTKFKLKEQ